MEGNKQEYEYMLLDRLRTDCDYFLGNGNRNEKNLWAGNVGEQIEKMKELYNKLVEKPKWITMEDIENYEKEMTQEKNVINESITNLDDAKSKIIKWYKDKDYDCETIMDEAKRYMTNEDWHYMKADADDTIGDSTFEEYYFNRAINEVIEHISAYMDTDSMIDWAQTLTLRESKNLTEEPSLEVTVSREFNKADGKVPETITFKNKKYKQENVMDSNLAPNVGKVIYYVGNDVNESDDYFYVTYTLNKVGENAYKGVENVVEVIDYTDGNPVVTELDENKKLVESTTDFRIVTFDNKDIDYTIDIIKQQIKDPLYFRDNEVTVHYNEDRTITPWYNAEHFYNYLVWLLDLSIVSSKMPQENVDKYLQLLNDLKLYAKECNNRFAVKAIDKIIQTKFNKFDIEGNKAKEDTQRNTTYYAIFNDGGNSWAYLRGSIYGNATRNWYWATSKNETRSEFRERLKRKNPEDLKIYDNKYSFLRDCEKHHINPDLEESKKIVDRAIKENKPLTEGVEQWSDITENDVQLYMNTWGNYNEYGADADAINGGWMNLDEAEEWLQEHSEEECFINDTDFPENLNIEVSDYSNPQHIIDQIRDFINCDNQEALNAIIEATGYDFEECLDIFNSGDFYYINSVTDEEDLARAYIDEVYGENHLADIGRDTLLQHIDEDEWTDQIKTSLRDNMDDEPDEELVQGLLNEEIESADDETLAQYFDYESYGRDMLFSNWTLVSTGAILIL